MTAPHSTPLSKFSAGSCVDFRLARILLIIKDLFPRPRYILITDFALVNSDALYWIRKNSGSSVWIAGNTSLDTVKSQGQVCGAFARHSSKYPYTVAFFMPAKERLRSLVIFGDDVCPTNSAHVPKSTRSSFRQSSDARQEPPLSGADHLDSSRDRT